MSASMLRCFLSQATAFVNKPGFIGVTPLLNIQEQVRQASTHRNKRGRTRGKGRGWKKNDGNFVHQGEVLATQLGLRYYPGENVGLGRKKTLIALCDGKVMVTTEILNPYSDSPLYRPVQTGLVVRKKFFHVVRTSLHAKFKLVNEI